MAEASAGTQWHLLRTIRSFYAQAVHGSTFRCRIALRDSRALAQTVWLAGQPRSLRSRPQHSATEAPSHGARAGDPSSCGPDQAILIEVVDAKLGIRPGFPFCPPDQGLYAGRTCGQ